MQNVPSQSCRPAHTPVHAQIMEGVFQSGSHAVVGEAFVSWANLADSFLLAGQLANPKRVSFILKPVFHALAVSTSSHVHQVGGRWRRSDACRLDGKLRPQIMLALAI